MGSRPEDLPTLDRNRLTEIQQLLTYESSVSFQSSRAHESMWMLVELAESFLHPPRTAEDIGYNIVNQLGDLWEVPVDVRQATNDRCWAFASGLVAMAQQAVQP